MSTPKKTFGKVSSSQINQAGFNPNSGLDLNGLLHKSKPLFVSTPTKTNQSHINVVQQLAANNNDGEFRSLTPSSARKGSFRPTSSSSTSPQDDDVFDLGSADAPPSVSSPNKVLQPTPVKRAGQGPVTGPQQTTPSRFSVMPPNSSQKPSRPSTTTAAVPSSMNKRMTTYNELPSTRNTIQNCNLDTSQLPFSSNTPTNTPTKRQTLRGDQSSTPSSSTRLTSTPSSASASVSAHGTPSSRASILNTKPEDVSSFIKTFVRLCPPKDPKSALSIQINNGDTVILDHVGGKGTPVKVSPGFKYHQAFHTDSTQPEIFGTVIESDLKEMIDARNGQGAVVALYGQSGSGKSYTSLGKLDQTSNFKKDDDSLGLVPRICAQLFDTISANEADGQWEVKMSFLQALEGATTCVNLLTAPPKTNDKSTKRSISKDEKEKFVLDKLKVDELFGAQRPVASFQEAMQLVESGAKQRHTASTDQNSQSSRSHALLSLYLYHNSKIATHIHLFDLAGSETHSGKDATQAAIGKLINGTLSSLQRMIQNRIDGEFNPGRDSSLTRLFANVFDFRSSPSAPQTQFKFIACVSTDSGAWNESNRTLLYAEQVKNMKPSKKRVNAQDDEAAATKLRRDANRAFLQKQRTLQITMELGLHKHSGDEPHNMVCRVYELFDLNGIVADMEQFKLSETQYLTSIKAELDLTVERLKAESNAESERLAVLEAEKKNEGLQVQIEQLGGAFRRALFSQRNRHNHHLDHLTHQYRRVIQKHSNKIHRLTDQLHHVVQNDHATRVKARVDLMKHQREMGRLSAMYILVSKSILTTIRHQKEHVSELQRQRDAELAKYEELQADIDAQLTTHQSQVDALQSEIQDKTTQLETLQTDLDASRVQCFALQGESQSLSDEVKDLMHDRDELMADNDAYKVANDELTDTNKDLISRLSGLENSLETFNEKQTQLSNQLKQGLQMFNQQVTTMDRSSGFFEQTIEPMMARIESLKRNFVALARHSWDETKIQELTSSFPTFEEVSEGNAVNIMEMMKAEREEDRRKSQPGQNDQNDENHQNDQNDQNSKNTPDFDAPLYLRHQDPSLPASLKQYEEIYWNALNLIDYCGDMVEVLTSQLPHLSQDHQDLSDDADDLNTALGELQTDHAILVAAHEALKVEMAAVREEEAAKGFQNSEEFQNMTAQITQGKAFVARIQTQLQELTEERDEIDAECDRLDGLLVEKEAEFATAIEEKEAELEQIKFQLNSNIEKIALLEQEVTEMTAQIAQADATQIELNSTQAHLSTLETALSAAQSDSSKLSKTEAELKQCQDQLVEMTVKHDAIKKQNESLLSKKCDLQTQLSTLTDAQQLYSISQQQTSLYKDTISSQAGNIEELKEALVFVRAELEQGKSTQNKLREQLANVELKHVETINSYKKDIATLRSEKGAFEADLKKKCEDFETSETCLAETKTALSVAQTELESTQTSSKLQLEQLKAKLDAVIVETAEKIEAKGTEIAQLNAEIVELHAKIEAKSKLQAQSETDLEQLRAQIETQTDQISQQQTQHAVQESAFEQIRAQNAEQLAEIALLRSQIESATTQMSSQIDKIQQYEATIVEKDTIIAEKEGIVAGLEKERAGMEVSHSTAVSQMAEKNATTIAEMEAKHTASIIEIELKHAAVTDEIGGKNEAIIAEIEARHSSVVAQLEEDHSSVTAQLETTIRTHLATIETHVGTIAAHVATIEQNELMIVARGVVVSQKEAEIDQLQKTIAEFELAQNSAKSEFEQISIESVALKSAIDRLEKNHKSALSQMESAANKSSHHSASLQKDLAAVQAQLKTVRPMVAKQKSDILKLEAVNNESKKCITELEIIQFGHVNEIASLKTQLELKATHCGELEQELERVHGHVESQGSVLNENSNTMDQLRSDLFDLQDKNRELSAQIDSLLVELPHEYQAMRENSLNEINKRYEERYDHVVAEHTKAVTKLATSVAKSSEEIKELHATITQRDGQIGKLEGEVALLRTDFKSQSDQIESQQKQISEQAEKIQGDLERITALTEDNNSYITKADAQADEIMGLNENLRQLGTELDQIKLASNAEQGQLQTTISNHQLTISQLESTISKHQQAITCKDAFITGRNLKIERNEAEKKVLEQTLEQAEAEKKLLQASWTEINTQMSQLNTQITALVSQTETQSAKILSLDADISSKSESIAALEKEVKDKKDEILRAEENLAALALEHKQKVAENDHKLAALALQNDQTVSQLEAISKSRDDDFAQLQTTLTQREERVHQLELVVGEKQKAITQLETSLSQFQFSISQLQSSISEKEQLLAQKQHSISISETALTQTTTIISQLESSLKSKSAIVHELTAEVKQLNEQITGFKAELLVLPNLHTEIAQLNMTLQERSEATESNNQTIAALRKEIQIKEGENVHLQTTVEVKVEMISILETDIRAIKIALDNAATDNATAQLALKTLQNEKEENETILSMFKEQHETEVREFSLQLATLRESLATAESKSSGLSPEAKMQISDLEEKNLRLFEQNANFGEMVNDLNEDLINYKKEAQEYEDEIKSLRADIAQLQARLKRGRF